MILLDLEERTQQETEQAKPFASTALSASATKPQDKLRPGVLKHLEAFLQRSSSHPAASQQEPVLQTSQRWARQLMFLLRQ